MRRRFTGRLGRRSMRRRPIGKMLLLAATLGALTTMPAAASAPGHSSGLQHLASSFGVKIILHDAPKVCSTATVPGGICDPSPGPGTSTIMRRDRAGTSHGVPRHGISIARPVITIGGPAGPGARTPRRSATSRRGGIPGTAVAIIGVGIASRHRTI
jgi:hypothetical protein